MGAVGLAVRTVMTALIGINRPALMIARANGRPFKYEYQLLGVTVLLSAPFLAKWSVSTGLSLLHHLSAPGMILLGVLPLHVVASAAILAGAPGPVGMTREARVRLRNRLARWAMSVGEGTTP